MTWTAAITGADALETNLKVTPAARLAIAPRELQQR